MNTRRRGAHGESIAALYLIRNGYRILAQNFRSRRGEVDIVCENERYLVFVEVKSWRSLPYQELERAIDARKQRRITQSARVFMGRNTEYANRLTRFDVILVRPADESIEHIEGAFEEECRE